MRCSAATSDRRYVVVNRGGCLDLAVDGVHVTLFFAVPGFVGAVYCVVHHLGLHTVEGTLYVVELTGTRHTRQPHTGTQNQSSDKLRIFKLHYR